ncbi:hypothetical protein BDV25DRAFT_141007 [Aspergillus avenaceus]|uniref:Conidiation protein 6-domain-containing protein n=1 Tax=Aspergillus avenaceus TaxID=36643 RepID=A0A5N6TSG8_ASPAV|nr:hypothetical protein BDV25DRAFT_141007 [Aspergillus avenaceus]
MYWTRRNNTQSQLDQLGDQPSYNLCDARGGKSKDHMGVNAGLKTAAHNPNTSQEGRESVAETVGVVF